MTWQGILGHDKIVDYFRNAAQRGRLSGSYLFIGPDGIGKRKFAIALTKSLLCLRNPEADLNPCGQCASCREVEKNSHPDLEIVCKPDDKSFIPLDFLIGSVERRNSEGLCHFLSINPQFAKRKIAILDDADYLNAEGANAMLKTLEEPPPNALFILLGTSAAKQLPTIRSRCRIIRFDPLSYENATQILQDTQIATGETAEFLARAGQGSLSAVQGWLQPGFMQFRENVLKKISTFPFDAVGFSQLVQNFAVEGNRKDNASQKREVIRAALVSVIQFFDVMIRILSGQNIGDIDNQLFDNQLKELVQSRLNRWRWDVETAARAVEITLKMEELLIRNVHPLLLCDTWSNSLAELFNTGNKA